MTGKDVTKTTVGAKKETPKRLCHVCKKDITDMTCGRLNNDFYCSACFYMAFQEDKPSGAKETNKNVPCHVCGKDVTKIGGCPFNGEHYCYECFYVNFHGDMLCGKSGTDPNMKSSNPKDLAAVTRVPMHLWPMTATVHGCAGIYDGMRKYGYYNWRHDKVSIMTYVSALQRHLFRYIGGQWATSDSGVSHLGHMLACLAILVDAHESGQVIDDRPIAGPDVERLMEETERLIERIAERHKDKHPVHYYRGTEVTP